MDNEAFLLREYDISFVGFILLCTILFLIMGLHTNRNMGSRREINLMLALIWACIVTSLAEAFDRMGLMGLFPYPILLNYILNAVDLLGTMFTVYFWFLLISQYNRRHFFSRKIPHFLSTLPLIIMASIIISSFWTGAAFYISEDGRYVRGPLYIFQIIFAYSYYFLSTGICLDGYIHGSVVERNLFQKLFLYSLFPIMGGAGQVALGVLPFSVATMLISVFYTFLRLQNQRINTDAMTGLNNKLCTQQYIERMIRTANHDPFYLYMMDVNHFKNVNDTYGHLAGDHALIVVSEALRKSTHSIGGFVGRFGGDEFTAIIPQRLFPIPSSFQSMLNTKVVEIAKNENLEVPLSLSVGWALCQNTGETVDGVIARADAMLYEVKKNRK